MPSNANKQLHIVFSLSKLLFHPQYTIEHTRNRSKHRLVASTSSNTRTITMKGLVNVQQIRAPICTGSLVIKSPRQHAAFVVQSTANDSNNPPAAAQAPGGISEEVLARLRAAEEEAAALREQLAAAQASVAQQVVVVGRVAVGVRAQK